MLSSVGKRPTTQTQVVAGKPGWLGGEVNRALQEETGKAVTGQLEGMIPDIYFLIDTSSLLELYV